MTSLEDLWTGNYIATSSTMFRKGLFGPFPHWYESFFPITDWPLHILNAEHGHIGYLNAVMAVYRHHRAGCYSRLCESEKLDCTLDFYRRMNACLDFKYDALVRTATTKYFVEWSEEYLRRGDRKAARRCFRRALLGSPVNKHVSWKRIVALAMELCLPGMPARQALTPTQIDGRSGRYS
jgi:hypothetical protein